MMSDYLTEQQIAVLLRPIRPGRIRKLDGMSHLEAYDVRAHLNRVFGFGRWSADVTSLDLLYDEATQTKAGKDAFSCAYRATVRLVVNAPDGTELATYTEAATGGNVMPAFKRADGHDFAIKTAVSQALKRCATNLGDQFGLSLYRNGSTDALVRQVLVGGVAEAAEAGVDDDAPDVEAENVDTTTGEITEPRKYARPVSELDAERNPDDPEAERAARLAEAKVRRDVLGVDSSGRKRKGEPTAERYDATTLPADDPWTVSTDA